MHIYIYGTCNWKFRQNGRLGFVKFFVLFCAWTNSQRRRQLTAGFYFNCTKHQIMLPTHCKATHRAATQPLWCCVHNSNRPAGNDPVSEISAQTRVRNGKPRKRALTLTFIQILMINFAFPFSRTPKHTHATYALTCARTEYTHSTEQSAQLLPCAAASRLTQTNRARARTLSFSKDD